MLFELPTRELMSAEVGARHRDALRNSRRWLPGVRRSSTDYRNHSTSDRRNADPIR